MNDLRGSSSNRPITVLKTTHPEYKQTESFNLNCTYLLGIPEADSATSSNPSLLPQNIKPASFRMPDFKPKVAVQLAPPKSDPISLEELAKADGE
jgi:hypothetical protein